MRDDPDSRILMEGLYADKLPGATMHRDNPRLKHAQQIQSPNEMDIQTDASQRIIED
jgi:hypothetical protein